MRKDFFQGKDKEQKNTMYHGLSPLSDHAISIPENLNTFLNDSKLFSVKKNDWATTVGMMNGNIFRYPCALWVKRFNYRGVFDFIVKKIIGSRAKRLYKINLRLYEKGLPVSVPLAYVEPSLREKSSFCISTVIDNASNLSELYKKGLVTKNRKLIQQLAETIARWHLSGAVHGDLKWPNILVQIDENNYKIFLVDLDQAKLYPEPSLSGIIKDLKRFYRFGLEIGAEKWVESEFLPAYIAFIPDEIKSKIDLADIKNKALKDWIKKGSKKW